MEPSPALSIIPHPVHLAQTDQLQTLVRLQLLIRVCLHQVPFLAAEELLCVRELVKEVQGNPDAGSRLDAVQVVARELEVGLGEPWKDM